MRMTDFLAMYFSLQLAVAILICALIWRFWILYLVSGFCWGVVALYTILLSHTGDIFIWAFSIFCIAMAIMMFFANWWLPKKKMQKDEYSQFSTTEDWANPRERKQHEKMWGKTVSQVSAENEKKMENEAKRSRGEWVDPED